MDQFSFFFAFYGLILGLAVTELLSGFAGMVRAQSLKKLEAQTALLALFTFISICVTWIDAWSELRSITLDFAGLWAPILLATAYYLAAAVIFPHDSRQFGDLLGYYAGRKRFVVAMVWLAVALETVASRAWFEMIFRSAPRSFWFFLVPYNLAMHACFLALLLVRSRRANITLLAAQILLLLVPYWQVGAIARLSGRLIGN